MKIAFVSAHFGSSKEMSFGPNPLIYNIIKGVAEKEDVIVLAGNYPKKPAVEAIGKIKVLRVFSNHPQFLGKGPYLNFGALGLGKILSERPDAINSQDFDAAFLYKLLNIAGSKIPKSTSVKSLMKARLERTSESLKKKYPLGDKFLIASQKIFEKTCIKNSDSLIVQSNYAKKELEKFYNPKAGVKLIHNGVDCRAFRPLKKEHEEQRLFFAGGIDAERKGADVFYTAFAGLRGEFPKLKATVIGAKNSGPFTQMLKKANALESIEFIERAPYTKMPALLNKASIVLVPSYHETFGSVAAEAMACGKPVVASDSTALPEVIGKAGILARTGNAKDFEEKIRRLLLDERKRKSLGKKARERVLENFTLEKTVKEYLEFFRDSE